MVRCVAVLSLGLAGQGAKGGRCAACGSAGCLWQLPLAHARPGWKESCLSCGHQGKHLFLLVYTLLFQHAEFDISPGILRPLTRDMEIYRGNTLEKIAHGPLSLELFGV